jgi:hypothetical protein
MSSSDGSGLFAQRRRTLGETLGEAVDHLLGIVKATEGRGVDAGPAAMGKKGGTRLACATLEEFAAQRDRAGEGALGLTVFTNANGATSMTLCAALMAFRSVTVKRRRSTSAPVASGSRPARRRLLGCHGDGDP